MRYGVFGPFKVPRRDSRRIVTPRQLRDFWEGVGEKHPGLPDASGCYIFGIRAGGGATPWYVGQAKKTFRQECFTPHKLLRYNEALVNLNKGTPILLFLARQTPGGRICEEIIKTRGE